MQFIIDRGIGVPEIIEPPPEVHKKINIPAHLCLAQQVRHCPPEVVGHRCGSPFVFFAESRIMRTTRGRRRQRPTQTRFTHSQGL